MNLSKKQERCGKIIDKRQLSGLNNGFSLCRTKLYVYFCRQLNRAARKRSGRHYGKNQTHSIMDNSEKNDGQLKIELTPEVADGIYANLAIITHSSAEFVLDLIRVLPGLPKANVKSRIIMAPEHSKRLLYALQDNIRKYEKAYGTINLPNNSPEPAGRTATPFGIPEGKA